MSAPPAPLDKATSLTECCYWFYGITLMAAAHTCLLAAADLQECGKHWPVVT